MGLIVFGDQAFRDRGLVGVGIQGYSGAQGYTPSDIPTKVGARYFLSEARSDFDDDTDQPIPIAKGNKWDGGKAVYQQRVYNAMKAHPDVKQKELDMVKPRVVA